MAIDKAVDSGALDAGLKQIADAIRAKGSTSAQLTFPGGMAAAVAAIEASGGGSNWTDNYSVFATGTFTTVENLSEISIDTGVPYTIDINSYAGNQTLIIFREPDGTVGVGWMVGLMGGPALGSGYSYTIGVVTGVNGDFSSARIGKKTCPMPNEGDTTWEIAGLTAAVCFRAGKHYRWILLGALK